jgi:hypothetical protein
LEQARRAYGVKAKHEGEEDDWIKKIRTGEE